jgi:hypothetical protein
MIIKIIILITPDFQDALNQQTFEQFKAFAEQQYPDNPDQVCL